MSSQYIPPKMTNLKVTSKERSMDQIQSEYMQAAVELGNIEYQIKTLEVQKGSCISKMSGLSLESVTHKESQNGKASASDETRTSSI